MSLLSGASPERAALLTNAATREVNPKAFSSTRGPLVHQRLENTLTIKTSARLNDVDIEAVGQLIGAVKEDPDNAETTWSATVVWSGGFRSEARIREFAPLRSDEPATLGGDDTGPNPVEQLLASLGNCLAVGYAANATASGIALDALEIGLEGDLNLETFLGLDDEGNAGYKSIRADVRIESSASEEEIEALHRRVIATSPVGHTLSRAIELSVGLTPNG